MPRVRLIALAPVVALVVLLPLVVALILPNGKERLVPRTFSVLRAHCLALVLVVPGLPAGAQEAATPPTGATDDWPMYRGDPARAGVMPGPGPEGVPVERWRYQVEGEIHSAPAIVGGVLYVGGGDGGVYALAAATGSERWRFALEGGVDYGPVVTGVVAYLGATFGIVYAIGGSDAGAVATPGAGTGEGATPTARDASLVELVWDVTVGGAFLGSIGEYGTAPGQFKGFYSVAVDAGGFLYVADFENNRLRVFGPDDTVVGVVDSVPGAGSLALPVYVTLDAERHLDVAEEGNARVLKLRLLPPLAP